MVTHLLGKLSTLFREVFMNSGMRSNSEAAEKPQRVLMESGGENPQRSLGREALLLTALSIEEKTEEDVVESIGGVDADLKNLEAALLLSLRKSEDLSQGSHSVDEVEDDANVQEDVVFSQNDTKFENGTEKEKEKDVQVGVTAAAVTEAANNSTASDDGLSVETSESAVNVNEGVEEDPKGVDADVSEPGDDNFGTAVEEELSVDDLQSVDVSETNASSTSQEAVDSVKEVDAEGMAMESTSIGYLSNKDAVFDAVAMMIRAEVKEKQADNEDESGFESESDVECQQDAFPVPSGVFKERGLDDSHEGFQQIECSDKTTDSSTIGLGREHMDDADEEVFFDSELEETIESIDTTTSVEPERDMLDEGHICENIRNDVADCVMKSLEKEKMLLASSQETQETPPGIDQPLEISSGDTQLLEETESQTYETRVDTPTETDMHPTNAEETASSGEQSPEVQHTTLASEDTEADESESSPGSSDSGHEHSTPDIDRPSKNAPHLDSQPNDIVEEEEMCSTSQLDVTPSTDLSDCSALMPLHEDPTPETETHSKDTLRSESDMNGLPLIKDIAEQFLTEEAFIPSPPAPTGDVLVAATPPRVYIRKHADQIKKDLLEELAHKPHVDHQRVAEHVCELSDTGSLSDYTESQIVLFLWGTWEMVYTSDALVARILKAMSAVSFVKDARVEIQIDGETRRTHSNVVISSELFKDEHSNASSLRFRTSNEKSLHIGSSTDEDPTLHIPQILTSIDPSNTDLPDSITLLSVDIPLRRWKRAWAMLPEKALARSNSLLQLVEGVLPEALVTLLRTRSQQSLPVIYLDNELCIADLLGTIYIFKKLEH